MGPRITNVITLYRYPGDPLPSFSCSERVTKLLEILVSEGWVALNTSEEIVGYVIARKAIKEYGWCVVPLMAKDKYIAEALLAETARFAESSSNKTLFLVIPEVNQNAMDFVEKFGGTMKFDCVRMFSSDPPEAIVSGYSKNTYSLNLFVG